MGDGTITTHSPAFHAELLASAPLSREGDGRSRRSPPPRPLHPPAPTPVPLLSHRRTHPHHDKHHRTATASTRCTMQHEHGEDESYAMLEQSLAGLREEHQAAIRNIDGVLASQEQAERRRAEELYHQWDLKVFRPIQQQVEDRVNTITTKELMERKNRDMNQYLSVSNTKMGVFRDIVIERDYDPFAPTRQTIRYSTRNVQNPLDRDIREDHRTPEGAVEDSFLSRDTLDARLWDRLESTPYYDRPERPLSDVRMSLNEKSDVMFDHYDYPRGKEGFEVWRKENPIYKKVVRERDGPERNPIDLEDPGLKHRPVIAVFPDHPAKATSNLVVGDL